LKADLKFHNLCWAYQEHELESLQVKTYSANSVGHIKNMNPMMTKKPVNLSDIKEVMAN